VPVKVKAHPASFTGRGIEVFANELPSAKERREQASANNRLRAVYRRNPKLANDVVMTETPSTSKKLEEDRGARQGPPGLRDRGRLETYGTVTTSLSGP
jgi:hypothetical protein